MKCKSPLHGPRNYVDRTCEVWPNYSARTFPCSVSRQTKNSNCCRKALSHWPEMKNSGRCSPWNFTKKYCTYTCHTLRVYSPPKVPLRPLSQTFLRIPKQYFVFVSSPKKQTHTVCNNSPNIVDLSLEDELQSCILVWRDSKTRCVHCN